MTLILALATSAIAEPASDQSGLQDQDPVENKISPESETSVKPAQPSVQQISEDVFKIGQVTLNRKTREISFPAFTHITEAGTNIEYLLVHSNGEKVHEALFITEVDPIHVNIALKLLNYQESPELFRVNKPDGTPGDTYPEVADTVKQAARFTIHASWQKEGQTASTPVTQWLLNRITQKPMPATPWVYNGSYVHKNKFKAKLTGSIFAIAPFSGAIANYPGHDREDDTLWSATADTPEQNTPVTITLKAWSKK